MQSIFISQPLRITTLGILLLLGGCATFSDEGGFNNVQSLTKERTGHDVTWIRSESDAQTVAATVKELLQQPLTAETAITIALLNNKGLQANYAELGISEGGLHNWVRQDRIDRGGKPTHAQDPLRNARYRCQ